jgi:inhibitor of KinA sporulation pathway (predicted exonuclease)
MSTEPQRLIIVDLEATCWERDPPAPHETIEIGSVCFEVGRGVLDEFQTFVRPHLQRTLSPFCTQLTTIRQADVDPAPTFPEAFAAFCRWADSFAPFTLAAWGNYDRGQLQDDCLRHGLTYPFTNYLNLKQAFARIRDVRPCGMAGALRSSGLPLNGTHHRGIDDVRNIACLVEVMLARAGPGRLWDLGQSEERPR